MTPQQIGEAATKIAAYLFVNGNGEEGERLVLTDSDGKDLGGWCKEAVLGVIVKQIREASGKQ